MRIASAALMGIVVLVGGAQPVTAAAAKPKYKISARIVACKGTFYRQHGRVRFINQGSRSINLTLREYHEASHGHITRKVKLKPGKRYYYNFLAIGESYSDLTWRVTQKSSLRGGIDMACKGIRQ